MTQNIVWNRSRRLLLMLMVCVLAACLKLDADTVTAIPAKESQDIVVCETNDAVGQHLWKGTPHPARKLEQVEACRGCDLKACEHWAWLALTGRYPDRGAAEGLRVATEACSRGHHSSCLIAAIGARKLGSPNHTEILKWACEANDRTSCVRATRALLERGNIEEAERQWKIACSKESAWACNLPASTLLPNTEAKIPTDVQQRFEAAGLVLEVPNGFTLAPYQENPHLYYDLAMHHEDKRIEVRYRSDTDPLILGLAESLLTTDALNLSGGFSPQITIFPYLAVQNEFNADWGGVASVPLGPGFNTDLKLAMIIKIVRYGVGAATVVFMIDDYEEINPFLEMVFLALRFKEPVDL